MSNIPSEALYIQAESVVDSKAVSQDTLQSMGGSINYMLDLFANFNLVTNEFLASTIWVCPANVTTVMVYGCGGGGGACNGSSSTAKPLEIYWGGAGAERGIIFASLTPGASYSIIIGQGGAPAYLFGQDGQSTTMTGPGISANFKGGLGAAYVHDIGRVRGAPADVLPKNVLVYNSALGVSGNATIPGSVAPGAAGAFGNGGNASIPNPAITSAAPNTGGGGGSYLGFGGSGRLFIVHT